MMPAVSSTDSVVVRDEAECSRVGQLEARHVCLVFDQRHRALGELAHRADDLGVAGMADQEHVAAEALVTHRLLVNLGDQRAGRVEVEEVARLGIGRHRLRHAMGREDYRARLMLGGISDNSSMKTAPSFCSPSTT